MAQIGLNKVIIAGNIGGEPEVRDLKEKDGKVVTLSVATSEIWNDKASGEQRENTEWHRVVLFGYQAEYASKNIAKGDKVILEGQLKTRKWQDQSGQDRYTTEVVVQGYTGMIQRTHRAAQGQPQAPQQAQPQAPQAPQQAQPQAPQSQGQPQAPQAPIDDDDDDIPF